MPAHTEITCDHCGADLTQTTNCEGYRLHLGNELIPSVGSVVTLLSVERALDEDAYFCGLICLREWMKGMIWHDRPGEKSPMPLKRNPDGLDC